ncbi:MAG: hypothetical protein OEM97_11875, partial [Acidimicrobiia bacterium]|nr:hypothetical protein [Acidimicrobiia bacterium]
MTGVARDFVDQVNLDPTWRITGAAKFESVVWPGTPSRDGIVVLDRCPGVPEHGEGRVDPPPPLVFGAAEKDST